VVGVGIVEFPRGESIQEPWTVPRYMADDAFKQDA